jgi:hypothetical protein
MFSAWPFLPIPDNRLRTIGAVAHRAAGCGELAKLIDCEHRDLKSPRWFDPRRASPAVVTGFSATKGAHAGHDVLK